MKRTLRRACVHLMILTIAAPHILLWTSRAAANTEARPCNIASSPSAPVKITACDYHLVDSGSNRNYYLVVDVTYTSSRAWSAVRFAFNVEGSVSYSVDRTGISAQGSVTHEFRLISPMVSLQQQVVCYADRAS